MKDYPNLLEISDLHVEFSTDRGVLEVVRGVSFRIPQRKTVALLGESGCGKSVTGLSILRLIDSPGRISSGSIKLYRDRFGVSDDGISILDLSESEIRSVRGNDIAMIFQEPRSSLTPVYTIGNQIIEAILRHSETTPEKARATAIELLAEVGIPAPERRIDEYPHQLSGGMCQRAMIAMALSCRPGLLIADEPTTALDVTIQAQVLDLLRYTQEIFGMAILIITHDMGVVAEIADEVVVMYLGIIVESGPVDVIFDNPLHPYTRGLFKSVPHADSDPNEPLPRIPGSVPDIPHAPKGCPFRGRCGDELPGCSDMPPETVHDSGSHKVRCWLHAADSQMEAGV